MKNTDDALDLLYLADQFRAHAALGLHYPSDDAPAFHRLRRLAAELTALVDVRDADQIEAAYSKDSGIRTPLAAIAVDITCSDGQSRWRVWHLPPDKTLPDALAEAAGLLGVDGLGPVVGLSDSHRLRLPGPHTYLAMYEVSTPLSAAQLVEKWEQPEATFQFIAALDTANETERPDTIEVSLMAGVILQDIAALAAVGSVDTTDSYNRVRFKEINRLAAAPKAVELAYPRIPISDHNIEAAATGAEAAILNDDGQILLYRRTDTGEWAMPGGACEVGESWPSTAVREAEEEGGLHIEITDVAGVVDNRTITPIATTIPIIAILTAKLVSGTFTPSREASEAKWFSADGLADLDLFAGHREKIGLALPDAK